MCLSKILHDHVLDDHVSNFPGQSTAAGAVGYSAAMVAKLSPPLVSLTWPQPQLLSKLLIAFLGKVTMCRFVEIH